jgi:hypothetical protein
MSDPDVPSTPESAAPSTPEPAVPPPVEAVVPSPVEAAVPPPVEAAVPPPVEAVVPPAGGPAPDRNSWNWLLFLPIVVPLIPALFNVDSPRLFGFPRFYWLQLAFIVLGVTTTTVVYQLTKKRR